MTVPAESYTKQDFIYTELLNRITSGIYPIDGHIPTEQELAREFQCSRGTVGRAIMRLVQEKMVVRKPHAGTRVIQQSGSGAAGSLELDACAYIYPSDQHEGIWRTGLGFQRAAHSVKRRTLMLSTGTDFRKEAEIVGRLGEFNVKGAVLFPVITGPTELAYYSQMILACPFPVVLAELTIPGIGRPAVVVDGLHAGYTMTRHLLERGVRRIGFLAHYAWAPFMRDRYLGYRQALEEAGIEENPEWVRLESRIAPDFEDPLKDPGVTAKAYLEEHGREIEAVVCSCDFIAVALIQEALRQGFEVPRDLKIAGIDDHTLATSTNPALTTYRVPYETLGAKAFETLEGLLKGGAAHATETQIRGELVVRESA